jgi:hypothetical protein
MKTSSITFLALGLLISCDRNHPSEPIASSKPVTSAPNSLIAAPISGDIRDEAIALTLLRTSSGHITHEALTKLKSMAPNLLEADLLIDVLNAVPLNQLPPFTDSVFESVRKLAPKVGQVFNPKYEAAIRLAERLDPKVLAPIVFEHLAIAPPYEFPTFELPGGWGDASLAVHAFKGTQGMIATIVVQYGEDALIERYRNQLKTAPPQLQRVMVWALSRSPDLQDFELLWKTHSQTNNPALADTAKRAMNFIPKRMESLANDDPDLREFSRRGMASNELKSKAKALRERLQAANLVVQLTVWD